MHRACSIPPFNSVVHNDKNATKTALIFLSSKPSKLKARPRTWHILGDCPNPMQRPLSLSLPSPTELQADQQAWQHRETRKGWDLCAPQKPGVLGHHPEASGGRWDPGSPQSVSTQGEKPAVALVTAVYQFMLCHQCRHQGRQLCACLPHLPPLFQNLSASATASLPAWSLLCTSLPDPKEESLRECLTFPFFSVSPFCFMRCGGEGIRVHCVLHARTPDVSKEKGRQPVRHKRPAHVSRMGGTTFECDAWTANELLISRAWEDTAM